MKIEGQPFEIQIIGEDDQPVTETSEGYVGLRHGEHYKIRFTNHLDTRACIHLNIDGTPVETGLVIGKERIGDLETIPGTNKRITFFAQGSEEAKQALLDDVTEQNLGVISASFTREKKFEMPKMKSLLPRIDLCSRGYDAGGTGLSGHSNQRFVPTIFDTDKEYPPVTINLRLAHDPERTKALDAAPIPGRRQPVSNDVPPPVKGPTREFK